MHVFVTGGSGLIGSSLIRALVAAGHEVTAISRSDRSVATLEANGAKHIIQGDLDNLEVLRDAASKADAVIHLGFAHDLSSSGKTVLACEKDREAISSMCDALVSTSSPTMGGKRKIFMQASGTLGGVGSDETAAKIPNPQHPRYLSELLTTSYVEKGLRTINLRFSPVVHSDDREHPFISIQIAKAKECGYVGYIEEGSTVLPSVHVKDAADLIVLALAKTELSGVNLHAAAEEGIPIKKIAEFIAKRLGLETRSVKSEDAMSHWGFVGMVLAHGSLATNKLTKQWTGWQPKEIGLLEEMDKHYKF